MASTSPALMRWMKAIATSRGSLAGCTVAILPNKDVGPSIAAGSCEVDSMLVIPCSMSTLAAVANGASDDLIARAAAVMLKEGRKLLLGIRDTPFNHIHLGNMMRAQQG